ncbi:MAG: tetratricopeptide repeat protein, partial [Akkermansiaceae bacterium]
NMSQVWCRVKRVSCGFLWVALDAVELCSRCGATNLPPSMQRCGRVIFLLLGLAVGVGCSRPPEQQALPEWERNPGLRPKPAGRILGEKEVAWADEKFANFAGPAPGVAGLDASAAERQYLTAAEKGQAWAQTRLGALYARAENDPLRWAKAVELLQRSAGQGDAEAQYELAGMAAAGRGLPASDLSAFGYMKEAAARGMADAQYQLAAMYSSGRGTAPDKAAAIEWGRRAAQQGHVAAQFSLGCLMVESAEAATKTEGVQWLERAAGAGNRQAALFLSAALARGEFGLGKDEKRAEKLLQSLAEKGDGEAQFVIAWLYMFGEKFADRRELARDYLQMAADGGHEQAAAALESMPAVQ